ncbi:hypothetical protein AHiyo6_15040, partial [Arthrobacter sp. Hiyo6]
MKRLPWVSTGNPETLAPEWLCTVVGDLEASIEHGDAGPEWLGRPHPRDVGPGLWDLFQSLWAVYLHARHLRDAYLDDFDEYLLARIDAATLRYSHPNRARLA